MVVLLGIAALSVSQFATGIVNWVATLWVAAIRFHERIFPRHSAGITHADRDPNNVGER